ncbi:hypothetical protein N836_02430 [Leptolyngbya sp. Heron Island J]|nr:hypothetical protein N836_02430 [Leptolyngbya sp. Heron Island J]
MNQSARRAIAPDFTDEIMVRISHIIIAKSLTIFM